MKPFLILMLLATTAFGAISEKAKYNLNNVFGQAAHEMQLGTLIDEGGSVALAKDGHQPRKVAIATYDYAVNGGSSASAINLGVTIPNNALVTRSFVYVISSLAGSGASVTLGLASANDVMTGTGPLALTAGTKKEGVQDGTMSNAIKLSADKALLMTISNADLTAGKLKAFVEYVIAQ